LPIVVSAPADVAVVGGGIVGLATAYRVLERLPGTRVAVLEKEPDVGLHQSSHNSGVLHAGIYYPPGSLKARLAVTGKAMLERYAAQRGIPVTRNGKLIVAVSPHEISELRRLAEHARANGVRGARLVDRAEMREIEPAVVGLQALHSPATAVTDFAAVCRALAGDIAARGGEVCTGWPVTGLEERDGEVVVSGPAGQLRARVLVACAGLQADRIAALGGGGGKVADRIVPFRGSYYRLRPSAARLVRGNIYPVPDPRFPFLGVHLTRRIDDQVWAGPNAFVAFARERYSRTAFDRHDTLQTVTYPGFWRFARRNLPAAATELRHELSRAAYARELARYVPAIGPGDLERGPVGIRAQIITRDGRLVTDFAITSSRRLLHVRNAPSPAATASLAIADLLTDGVAERLAPRG
jgi:(S)-2-hydroxyglutarate dehydrogenase